MCEGCIAYIDASQLVGSRLEMMRFVESVWGKTLTLKRRMSKSGNTADLLTDISMRLLRSRRGEPSGLGLRD